MEVFVPEKALRCVHESRLCPRHFQRWRDGEAFNTVRDKVAVLFAKPHLTVLFWYLGCCGCPGLRGRQHQKLKVC